jgi:uncharacterized damage-inducible protein DinB
MRSHALPPVDGYDPETQRTVAFLAASLDDQTRRIRTSVQDLPVEILEWQEAPERNTVGMLLAHMAVAEAWWIQAGAKGIGDREEISGILRAVIGIEAQDDGMPLPAGGTHPEVLRGKSAADYLALLDRARVATHAVLRSWSDAELDTAIPLRERSVTPGWILYHVLEHTVAHYGQILLLLRIHADRGAAV